MGFENCFDDELRFVDVSQEVVLRACLPNGEDTVKKIQKAYDKCFGEDYSFDDLAATVGRDSDNDDLPDEYEGNEACFYKTMDWVKGRQVQPSVIEDDMAGLQGFDRFKENINSCSAWSGNFGGRKRRAVGDASEDTEEVPSIMESGSGALQWVRSLVRRARSAEPKKGDKGKKVSNKDKGKGKGKGRKNRNGKARKGDKRTGKGNRGKGKENKKKGKGRNKNGKKGRSNKKSDKKKNEKNEGRNGKSSDLLPDFVYNQLWCFDLAMEQALERCVEDKLNN